MGWPPTFAAFFVWWLVCGVVLLNKNNVALAVEVSVESAASPSATDDCTNLKTVHGTSQCRELHPEAQYYALWNQVDVATDTHLTIKLVLANPTTGRSGSPTGWLAFGINKSGGMKGADIALVNKNTGSWTVEDMFSDMYDTPVKDALQNWEMVSSTDDADGLVFEIRRELDTCDFFDQKIIEMEFFCLWAFGSSYDFVHHGTTRGSFGCELTDRDIPSLPAAAGLEAYAFTMFHGTDHNDPAHINTEAISAGVTRHNQYLCSYMYASDIFGVDTNVDPYPERSIVAVEPYLDNGGPYVHHMLLYACDGVGDTPPPTNYDCLMIIGCSDFIYAWAVGGARVTWPSDVGLTLGKPNKNQIYMINMHYYNPNLLEGQTDASGFKFFSLPQGQKRSIEMGTWLYGPLSFQQPALQTKSYFNMYCPVECFEPTGPEDYTSSVESKDLNMMYVIYHAHFDGRRQDTGAWSITNDGGSSVLAKDSFNNMKVYDYNHQTANNAERAVLTRGADGMYLNCHWDFRNRDVLMSWGDGSNDEMCFGAALSWPRQPKQSIGPCAGEVKQEDHSWVADVRTTMAGLCETHCDGHATADEYPVPKNANDDLFPHQAGYSSRFTRVVTTAKATQISEWKDWCKSCHGHSTFECETCETNGDIANDDYCAKAAHKGVCPPPAGVNTPASDGDIDTFVEAEIAKRNNRLCVTWCKAGKHSASLWSCSSGIFGGYDGGQPFGVGPPTSESQKFSYPVNTCAKASLAVKTPDDCSAHDQCSTVQYCAAGQNAFTGKTPIERLAHNPVTSNRRQLGNANSYLASFFSENKNRRRLNAVSTNNDLDLRNWCGSCSRCCQMYDAFDGNCPSKCDCAVTGPSCQAQGRIFCEADSASDSSCVDMPSGGTTEAQQCYLVCPHPATSPYMVYWPETRSCQRCIDHDAEYTRRVERYAEQFSGLSAAALVLNLYKSHCGQAPMLIQLVTIAVNGVQGLSAELFEPIFRELREVCLYTFRDEASIPCELSTGPVIYVATSGGGGGGGGAAGEDEGLDPTIIAGVAVLGLGVVGLVVYVAFSSGLMGGTTATTEVTRMPAAINPPANAYQPQGGGDKDRFVSLS